MLTKKDSVSNRYEKHIECFILTNGAGSALWAEKSLKAQTVQCKITCVSGLDIVQAMESCLALSEAKYFIKVDDDMFLHPQTVNFMIDYTKKHGTLGLYGFLIWEPWQKRTIKNIKIYNTDIARKIGFCKNDRGKIDRIFAKQIVEQFGRKHLHENKSVVAIHALRSLEDQIMYRDMWMKNSVAENLDEYMKIDKDQASIFQCSLSYEEQYAMLSQLLLINKHSTDFYRFCRTRQ